MGSIRSPARTSPRSSAGVTVGMERGHGDHRPTLDGSLLSPVPRVREGRGWGRPASSPEWDIEVSVIPVSAAGHAHDNVESDDSGDRKQRDSSCDLGGKALQSARAEQLLSADWFGVGRL